MRSSHLPLDRAALSVTQCTTLIVIARLKALMDLQVSPVKGLVRSLLWPHLASAPAPALALALILALVLTLVLALALTLATLTHCLLLLNLIQSRRSLLLYK